MRARIAVFCVIGIVVVALGGGVLWAIRTPALSIERTAIATQPSGTATPAGAIASEPVGFPRPVLFRAGLEQLAIRGVPVEQVIALATPYDLVLAKGLDEEIEGWQKVAPYLRAIKARFPQKLVLDHYDILSHRPEGTSPTIFPGHWLMLTGTTLSSALSATPGESTLTIADAGAIRVNDDVQVVALGADGRPDYAQVEQMRVTAVSGTRVTVQRGMYGSTSRTFEAGKAKVAAHARVLWGGTILNWHLNFCREAPRDPQGRRTIEALAQALAGYLQPGGLLAGLDGYQFDVERFEAPTSENGGPRRVDCNNDGVADSGYLGGVSSYGLGMVEFQQALRTLVGDQRLLISEATGSQYSRDFAFANGIENESFPDFHHWEQFSSAYQRYQYWIAEGRAPHVSYLQLKETTQAFTRCVAQDTGTNWKYRLALGVALLGDGHFAYLSTNEAGSPQCNYIDRERNIPFAELDELFAGPNRSPHYLGAPTAPAQRLDLASTTPNLLSNGTFDADLAGATLATAHGATATLSRDATQAVAGGGSLRVTLGGLAADPDDADIEVRFAPVRLVRGREYTLQFQVRAEPGYGAIDARYSQVPSRVSFRLGKDAVMQDVIADGKWRPYSLAFVAGADDVQASVAMLVGSESGSVWLDSARLVEGGADRFVRRFERGVVLVNGSTTPASFDLDQLAPGMPLRRLQGPQDPEVNTGAPVRGVVTIAGRDALILVAQ